MNQDEFERLKSELDKNEDKLHCMGDKLHHIKKKLVETQAQVHGIMDFIKLTKGCIPSNLST